MSVELSAQEINVKINHYHNKLTKMLSSFENNQEENINIQETLNHIEVDMRAIVEKIKQSTPEFRESISENLESFSSLVSKCQTIFKEKMEMAQKELMQTQQHRQGIQAYQSVKK